MFWDSVIGGLKLLAYWEVYFAFLLYIAICLIPLGILELIMINKTKYGALTGCSGFLMIQILQSVATMITILILAPLILGISENASWSLPYLAVEEFSEKFLKFVGVMIVLSILLWFIPIVGGLPSFHTIVIGSFTLAFSKKILGKIYPSIAVIKIDFDPGLWFFLGIVIIGGILMFIGKIFVYYISINIKLKDESWLAWSQFPFLAMFGFIPVFIYGAWLGIQFK